MDGAKTVVARRYRIRRIAFASDP